MPDWGRWFGGRWATSLATIARLMEWPLLQAGGAERRVVLRGSTVVNSQQSIMESTRGLRMEAWAGTLARNLVGQMVACAVPSVCGQAPLATAQRVEQKRQVKRSGNPILPSVRNESASRKCNAACRVAVRP